MGYLALMAPAYSAAARLADASPLVNKPPQKVNVLVVNDLGFGMRTKAARPLAPGVWSRS